MISTGIKALDNVITGLRLGDNVVWQFEDIDDYIYFVDSFAQKAISERRKLIYVRFASHKPLIKKQRGVIMHEVDSQAGFESFSGRINQLIKENGNGAFYVFDCLSDLLSAWSNDLMIGNFFKITCPFLFELETIAYFGLLRNNHSFKTVARIRDTTQLLIDIYRYVGNCYIHPIKVWNRYSPTMFLPHIKRTNMFTPLTSSMDSAKLFAQIFKKGSRNTERKLDYWDRLFISAEELDAGKGAAEDEKQDMIDQLSRILISRDDKILKLAKKYLKLEDFIYIKTRMIGTGFIGGKSTGMLIARNILLKDMPSESELYFEPHDSFYIGSDVFYSYIVENGWWKTRMEQRTKEGYFDAARILRNKLLSGVFPEEIKEQFQRMIEYFGQSPIIVRSSSLLEDSYGNAFAGKYESVFLSNQGTPEERYNKFTDAVRKIYASTMSDDALAYRMQRGLDRMDEQMALLVQRVSGAYHKDYFFPDAAGVGISYNVFVWKNTMDPRAGMLRLVLGLGTRSVNRVEGDYPRIVALDDPLLKAQAGIKDAQRFSQHEVDLLNIKEGCFQTISLRELLMKKVGVKLDLIATRDYQGTEKLRNLGIEEEQWIINFDELVSQESFILTVKKILCTLENAYDYPVDIEFTINFKDDGRFQINILQCRPMQAKGPGRRINMPEITSKNKALFRLTGNFLGGNTSQNIDRIIYVDPQAYCDLETQSSRYDIARIVGILNRRIEAKEKPIVMLLGPGRWGTSTPSLGVPVTFSEINNISVLVEMEFITANASPEISFGTHFFQDLVETGILYLAIFSDRADAYFNKKYFDSLPATLEDILPQYSRYRDVVKVCDLKKGAVKIATDIITQKALCYFNK